MNRDENIRQCIIQHLSNSEKYKKIAKEVVEECNNESMKEFLDFIRNPPNYIDQEDYKHQLKADNQLTGTSTLPTKNS